MKLVECPVKSNNLQLLRFVAAILVIVSHSFSISTGTRVQEWLSFITRDQISLGGVAVSIFFCAGGFLIAKSVLRVKNGVKYFKARALRIFPALVVVVLITAFVLGPIVTEYGFREYFSNVGVYKYLLNAVFVLQHNLPGVFENNPYLSTVNGSLWTLPIEFLCYIGCFVMWKADMLKKKNILWSIPIVAIGTAGLYFVIQRMQIEVLMSAIRPSLLFYMGILCYIYRDKIEFTPFRALLSFAILIATGFVGVLDLGMVLAFPYLLLYVCFALPQVSDKIAKLGNLSYGMYLCGFPIQQTIVMLHGGDMSPFLNVIISTPLAILGGILIYYMIEVPIIKIEKR